MTRRIRTSGTWADVYKLTAAGVWRVDIRDRWGVITWEDFSTWPGAMGWAEWMLTLSEGLTR